MIIAGTLEINYEYAVVLVDGSKINNTKRTEGVSMDDFAKINLFLLIPLLLPLLLLFNIVNI